MNDKSNGYWWCPFCQCRIEPQDVTNQETHDIRAGGCGNSVVWGIDLGLSYKQLQSENRELKKRLSRIEDKINSFAENTEDVKAEIRVVLLIAEVLELAEGK